MCVSCIFNKEEMSNSTCGEATPELFYNRSICCQNLGSGLYPPKDGDTFNFTLKDLCNSIRCYSAHTDIQNACNIV